MTETCDSENLETQIDKPKASGSTMTKLPWFEALQFSLRVMRKSFFKLFIPSMVLSFLFGAFHALLGFVLIMMFEYHFGPPPASIVLIIIAIVILLPLPIYAYLYPLLKRFVIFHGLQELNPFPFNEYKLLSRRFRYRFFLRLIKISLKRYSFQTIAFLVLLLSPIMGTIVNQKGLDIVIIFSLVSLWPLVMSYYNFFFAELRYLDEKSQELRSDSIPIVSPIPPHKKLFWPILSWKAIVFIVYIALLFVLYLSWGYIATLSDSQSGVMGNGNFVGGMFRFFAEGLSDSLSPFLTINLLFVYFASSFILGIQAVFLLLFGLLTAFFFLVETLSSVYFYHGCRETSEKTLQE